jgi:hypothetical protein
LRLGFLLMLYLSANSTLDLQILSSDYNISITFPLFSNIFLLCGVLNVALIIIFICFVQTNGGHQDGARRAPDCRDPARCHSRSYVAESAPSGGATNY